MHIFTYVLLSQVVSELIKIKLLPTPIGKYMGILIFFKYLKSKLTLLFKTLCPGLLYW